MLQAKREEIRELLLTGSFGLEKESLRVHGDGTLSHTDHPFAGNRHIVRDFCENQTEINTPVFGSAHEAVEALRRYDQEIQRVLRDLPQREYLWPFSNPPYIKNEDDVPVARFTGAEAEKTAYREYLSDRYGRYKMAFSGIHVNYSFGEELLRRSFALSGEADFRAYKDQLYVDLAQRAAAHGWLMVALTAANPVLDSSFVEKGRAGGAYFEGLASVRCSELGYWNFFAPIFDYSSLEAYAQSIQNYVDDGLLRFPTELYYPIRLKPAGKNSLPALREKGVNHIELRMFIPSRRTASTSATSRSRSCCCAISPRRRGRTSPSAPRCRPLRTSKTPRITTSRRSKLSRRTARSARWRMRRSRCLAGCGRSIGVSAGRSKRSSTLRRANSPTRRTVMPGVCARSSRRTSSKRASRSPDGGRRPTAPEKTA